MERKGVDKDVEKMNQNIIKAVLDLFMQHRSLTQADPILMARTSWKLVMSSLMPQIQAGLGVL